MFGLVSLPLAAGDVPVNTTPPIALRTVGSAPTAREAMLPLLAAASSTNGQRRYPVPQTVHLADTGRPPLITPTAGSNDVSHQGVLGPRIL